MQHLKTAIIIHYLSPEESSDMSNVIVPVDAALLVQVSKRRLTNGMWIELFANKLERLRSVRNEYYCNHLLSNPLNLSLTPNEKVSK